MPLRYVVAVPCILFALALAACSSGQPGNTSAPATGAQARASSPATRSGHYHAELALAAQPAITEDGNDILVTVNVTNDGPASFGTQATPVHNVNLGAHSIDAAGNVLDNDLARGSVPEVVPGATVKATILLPVDKALGHSVELIPVEEGVAWFDTWGTKPLVIGPFQNCKDAAMGKMCDGSGKPLPTASAQP